MNFPCLKDTAELIHACIKSCRTIPQLSTCREMVDSYIKQRYLYYENALAMALVLDELDKAIEDQRAVMVEVKYEEV